MIPKPQKKDWRIGVIGTGGISDSHLNAYAQEGWKVSAIWNRTRETAEAKRDALAKGARIEEGWAQILSDPEIDIVDVTLHPEHRIPIVEAALKAGKHVLSQKPFVTNLDTGERLINLALDKGLKLAVNQNGRFAPHFHYIRSAILAGRIGVLSSVHARVHWDHSWTAGTSFDDLEDLILYDFGVHWFDFIASIAGDRVKSVMATSSHATGQKNRTPLLAQALIRLDGGQASLAFDGFTRYGTIDETTITGSEGTIHSHGPDLNTQGVILTNSNGIEQPNLVGKWFDDGFRGTMAELMCSIEENREPMNSARDNLGSLALTFAAVQSRKENREIKVGSVRSLL
jgi:predicted dehydrogenase